MMSGTRLVTSFQCMDEGGSIDHRSCIIHDQTDRMTQQAWLLLVRTVGEGCDPELSTQILPSFFSHFRMMKPVVNYQDLFKLL